MAIVLLDLEETVIDSWEKRNALPANLEKIKHFLNDNDKLGLMSWAVWDAKDKEDFQKNLQLGLEQALEHPFTQELIFSMHDFSDVILKKKRKWVSRDDMFDLFGKEECLLQMLRLEQFTAPNIYLIDDCVDHKMTFLRNNQSVTFLNINEIDEYGRVASW